MSVARTLLGSALVCALGGQWATAQKPRFGEDVLVARVVIEARVMDRAGQPIAGLGPEDFLVKVDGLRVSLESAEWIAETGAAKVRADRGPVTPTTAAAPTPRLVVLFVQADLHPSRLSGLMRMWPKAVTFLSTLEAADQVALVSFDSHLKLHRDFTTDREAIRAAILPTVVFRQPPALASRREPSLATHLDAEDAMRAATPERALALLAHALEAIPGAKTVVVLGWGLGRFSRSGVWLPSDYAEAVAAFHRSHTTVVALDLTDADYHSLELGLEQIARDTGGFYAKTHLFPDIAMTKLAGALAGHYELVFEKPDLPAGRHTVTVRLARQDGTVLARPSYTN